MKYIIYLRLVNASRIFVQPGDAKVCTSVIGLRCKRSFKREERLGVSHPNDFRKAVLPTGLPRRGDLGPV